MTRRAVWLAVGLMMGWLVVSVSPVSVVGDPGIGKSENGLISWRWQPCSEGLPTYGMAVAVAVQPTDPTVVYAGTYEQPGLWRSDDEGRSWSRDYPGLEGSPVYALHWDAIRRRWWVGARNGLYTRPGKHAPWQPVGVERRPVYALAEDRTGRLYLATEGGLFRSNNGQAWHTVPIAGLTSVPAILSLSVSADGRTLLAGTTEHGLWISRDTGATWSSWQAASAFTQTGGVGAIQTGEDLGRECVSAVFVGSGSGRAAYASTSQRAYRSLGGSTKWEPMTDLDGRVHAFAVGADGMAYAALAGRVARSTDGGGHWNSYDAGLRPDDKVLDLVVSAADPALVYAAAWDGVYVSVNGGQHWERPANNVGYPDVNVLAWDGAGNLLAGAREGIYHRVGDRAEWELVPASGARPVLTFTDVGNGRDFYAGLSGGLLRSTDGGRTWSEVASELGDQGIAGVVADPAVPDHLLAWVAFGRVHESQNGGSTWVARWEGLGTVRPVTAIHRTQTGQLYVGAEDGLFRWEPARSAWQLLPLPLAAPTVFAVESDQRDPQGVYAGATDGLWRSLDGGRTWQRWGDGLEGVTVTALAVSPADKEIAFAGTRHTGLYATADAGQTWQRAWDGELGAASVRDILFSDDGATIYVATDRGIWQGDAHEVR